MLAALWLCLAIFEAPVAAAAVAGAAVSIPIIIHLLNRRRFKVVNWAAMRFLLAAQRKNSRRMRLEQLILLLVRCLVVLLLLLAMVSVTPWMEAIWRWFMPNAAAAMSSSSARTHKIVVLDGSFSMGARVGQDATAFTRARALASRMVRDSTRGDGFSVVLMASPPRRIVPEPSEDGQKVAGEIDALRLPHGNADVAATLSTVDSLLQASPGKFRDKEVYFFTDLQKSTWISAQPLVLSATLKKARTVLVDTGADDLANVAVTGLELNGDLAVAGRETIIKATLRGYGSNKGDKVVARLLVGRARGGAGEPPFAMRDVPPEQSVTLERNQDTTVAFKCKFHTPGDYLVQVRIEAANDALPLDDARSAVFTVKKDLPVLLINGKSFGDPFDQSAEWLRFALNPFPGEGVSVVRPKMINTAQFSDETLGDLTPYDCVFLCDVPTLSLAEAQRLEGHVRRGGGVVFFLGSQVQPAEYNRILHRDGAGLLPAALLGLSNATKEYQFQFALEQDSEREPPIRAFRSEDDRSTLLAARFNRFYQLAPPAAGVKPRRVLSFAPVAIAGREAEAKSARVPQGGPAILEWHPREVQAARLPEGQAGEAPAPRAARMRGRVVLVPTTANSEWADWTAKPSYPALMTELLYFAASGRLQQQSADVGQALEIYLPGAAGAEATVHTPDDRKEAARTQNLEDGSVLRWADTDVSGVYRVQLGQHPREHLFAVNVPALNPASLSTESNLERTNRDALQKAYPEWELQVVKELNQVDRSSPPRDEPAPEKVFQPLGPGIAYGLLLAVLALVLLEVILAFVFGHYSATTSTGDEDKTPKALTWPLRVLKAMPWVLLGFGLLVGGVLVHEAFTGDFLGFLSEGQRRWVEGAMGIEAPAPGEGSRWRLEYAAFFLDARSYAWLAGAVALGGAALIFAVYRHEGQKPTLAQRLVMMGLRVGVLLLLLVVFLPQLKVYFERQGWPDVVLLIDDSQSMSATERYSDADVREAADGLAKEADRLAKEKRVLAGKLSTRAEEREEQAQRHTPDDPERARLLQEVQELREQARALDEDAAVLEKAPNGGYLHRLHLLQALATRNDLHWLLDLVEKKKVKLHVYRCSTRAARVADVTSVEELPRAGEAIQGMVASPRHDSSQLGAAVRQVINDFRGSSLAAVVMLTDGVTTEGEDLVKVSKYAAQAGVPLFFVGAGDAHDVRDVFLHDLQAEDSVYVNDRLIFELRLTAQGYKNLSLPVTLHEKGQKEVLDQQMVQVDASGKSVKVRLAYTPKEAGEKVYELKVPVQDDEVEKDNNRLVKAVSVKQNKLIKVLYVEGYRRYEYHFLKTLLERESARVKGNKTMDLKVRLMDADPKYAASDRSALAEFPTRKELETYDVVILGDVNPEDRGVEEFLKDVAYFVTERGGGLLMVAGERWAPHAYKNSPLRDVLPVDVVAESGKDVDRTEGFRLDLTPIGRGHPIFRFTPNEKENDEIWSRLQPLFWWSEGYVPKRAAEVLAVHPTLKRDGKKDKGDPDPTGMDRHPLVLQQFVGSGRSMFFGIGETWRWGFREDQARYNQFWIQTVRYLSRNRLGKIDLRLDKQTSYRRGEPIKVTVRFPDDQRPAPDVQVKVMMERKVPGKGERQVTTLELGRLEGSRTTFEATVTQTPEGEYQFWLSLPAVPDPKPRAEGKVVAPPGEMYGLRMNQSDLEEAAAETQGKFYNLATADNLLQDLHVGNRVSLNASGPPAQLWNHTAFFLAALLLLTTEWLLRKRQNLL